MSEPLTLTSATPRLALPLLHVAQAHKEATVNEALLRADALLHGAVLGETATPPADPQPGQAWIVAGAATGAWAGKDGAVASFAGGRWHFMMPTIGLVLFDQAAACLARFADGGWQRAARPVAVNGGSTVDAEARDAIAGLVAALVDAGILPAD